MLLTWTASASPDVAGYNILRGTTPGGPYRNLNMSPVPETSYTDTHVLAGETYYYVCTAVDSGNRESAYSNEARADIPADAVPREGHGDLPPLRGLRGAPR